MTRAWRAWAIFAACLAVVFVALGWASLTLLKLDREQADARRQADLEERVRLALWRMDSAVAPIVAAENSRPPFAYAPTIPVDRRTGLYSTEPATLAAIRASKAPDVLYVPSPLLAPESRHALVYFTASRPAQPAASQPTEADEVVVLSPNGGPGYDLDSLIREGHTNADNVERATRRLAELEAGLDFAQLLKALPPARPGAAWPPRRDDRPGGAVAGQAGPVRQQSQEILAFNEAQARARNVDGQNKQYALLNSWDYQIGRDAEWSVSPMQPVWHNSMLLLVRRVAGPNGSIQGCWLDWDHLRGSLLDLIVDLLPEARLHPPAADSPARQDRLLAALPVVLEPGTVAFADPGRPWPLRTWLAAAWAAVLLASAVAALLLHSAIGLSQRRGAFVSAVTHELRTPLTTFRMYAEMLADDMVADPAKRARYLHTLRAEADRLSHLVANVLTYARLDGARSGGQPEALNVAELLERVRDRLSQRAEQAGLTLRVVPPGEPALCVRADFGFLEQILFNLVDNAAKYAAPADNRTVELTASADDDAVRLSVRDFGPGVPHDVAGRLFQPFSKSAHDAAGRAPGVGLGLALSRRLARRMGGQLLLDRSVRDGACFVLHLPRARLN